MREDWKEISLKEITCKIGSGVTPRGGSSVYIKKGTSLVRSQNIYNGYFDYRGLVFINEETAKKMSNVEILEDDILINITGDSVARCSIIPKKVLPARVNQHVSILRCRDSVNSHFIKYSLISPLYQAKLLSIATGAGSTRNALTKTVLEDFKIKIPPLEAQYKIANILSGYDDLIENNLKRIKILEEMAQQTYEEWFVRMRFPGYETAVFDENGLPEGWSIAKLRDVLVLNYGKALKQDVRIEGEFNVYGSSGVVGTHNDYLVEGPGLIIGRKGNVGSVHFENNNFYPIDTVYYATSELSLKYLYYLIKSLTFINNDAAIPGLNRDAAYSKEIIKPIYTLIKKFDDYCTPLYAIKENLQYQNQYLQETRDILLPRLMMGVIDTSTISVKSLESLETKQNEAKIVPLEQPKKETSKEFKEAVLIACLAERFSSEKYPLGRKRYTKLSYLFHRYSDNKIQDYLRKAAGPYNPKTKYGGPEKIALTSKYIKDWKGEDGTTGFVVAEKIDDAKKYFSNYWQIADLNWLVTEFKFKSNDELELLATVDNSLMELSKKNIEFTSANVLDIIKSEKEWKAKLERTIFSDVNVERAIGFLTKTLQYEK